MLQHAQTATSRWAGQSADSQPLLFLGLSSTGTRHDLITPKFTRTGLGNDAVRAGSGR